MPLSHLSREILAAGQWLAVANIVLVLMLIVRLEILKSHQKLPQGISTVTSPLRWKTSLWGKVMGDAQRELQGRLVRILLSDQHKMIADPWVTGLVYGCRGLSVLVIASMMVLIGSGILDRPG
jgi:hypothetical protein